MRPEVIKHLARALLEQHVVFGDVKNVSIAESAILNNTLFNVMSGRINVGEQAFFGHNVTLLTGSHDYTVVGLERIDKIPTTGRDIVIGTGAWIASNVTVIGPCVIGDHAVVAAGSLVLGDVPSCSVFAGIPAKLVRNIKPEQPKNILSAQ